MHYLTFFFTFVFGLIIGSFLNVVALRFNSKKITTGRSMCFSCGKILSFFELIPLLSFLYLKGKCKKCRTPISWQYPFVELITGVMFGLIALSVKDVAHFLFFCFAFSILIVIALYDAKHKIIPDSLSFLFGVCGFIYYITLYVGDFSSIESVVHVLSGPILFLPFFLIWFFSRGTWMGLGDAKLAVGIGWLLGLAGGLSAIIIGIWAGALWSVIVMVLQKYQSIHKKAMTLKSEIPLAPFLILGTLISFLVHMDIFNINLWVSLFLG